MIPEENLIDAYAMNVRNLRRRAEAVYLACDEAVAKDIGAALLWAADEIERQSDTKAIDEWIEREFAGYGVAIRRQTDDPIPGEPFMSMAEAKELARRLAYAVTSAPSPADGGPAA